MDKPKEQMNMRKLLYNEVSFGIAMIAMISGAIFWIQNPQDELEHKFIQLEARVESTETVTVALEKIKNNDLHEIQLRMEQLEDRQISILQAIAGIEALLRTTH